jgi:hypothetical protein
MADYQNDLIVRLKTEVDKAGQAALKEQADVVDKTANAYDKASKQSQKFGKAGKSAGYQIQNASYQIADFFVMLQGGISPVRALSTQLPQLLAGFGPFGAAAGAAAAVGASLFVAIDNLGESAQQATKDFEALKGALESLKSNETKQGIDAYAAAIKDASEDTKELAFQLLVASRAQADVAIKKTTEELNAFVTSLSAASDINNNIGSFDSLIDGQALQRNLDAIKSTFGIVGANADAVAQQILDLNNSFRSGGISVEAYLSELIRLGNENLIDTKVALEIFNQAEALRQAQQNAESFNAELKEIEVTAKRLGSSEAFSIRDKLDPSRVAVKKLREEILELNKAMALPISKGGLTKDEYDARLKQIQDQFLKPIVVDVDVSKAEQEAKKLVDAIDRANDPMIAINEQARLIKLSFALMGREASEAEKAINKMQNALLKEVTVDTSRRDAQLERANQILNDLDPIRNYRLQLTQLKADLAAVGATSDQVKQAVANLNDEFLQEVTVTASKKPDIDWYDLVDYEGYMAVQADIARSLDDWGKALGDSIVDALDRGMESFKEFADFIIRQIARIAIQRMVIEPLVNSLGNLFPGAKTSGIGLGEIEQTAGAASNARMESVAAVPMMGYIAAPSLGNKTSSQSPVTVNVNNYGNDDVQVEQRKTSRGLEIDVLIKGAVKQGIAQGDFDNVMRSSFGARRLAY